MKKGFRHGKLVTIKQVEKGNRRLKKHGKWLCVCDCGNETIVLDSCLYGRGTQSCGCIDYKNKKIYHLENYKELMKEKIKERTVKNENGCWIWTASKSKQGYGHISYNQKVHLAHRVSWILYRHEIGSDIKVCHFCDQPSCVNPEHLFLGTQKDNMSDAKKKGRLLHRKRRITKLTYDQVKEIRNLHSKGISIKQLQNKFLVSEGHIGKIINGTSWKINPIKEG